MLTGYESLALQTMHLPRSPVQRHESAFGLELAGNSYNATCFAKAANTCLLFGAILQRRAGSVPIVGDLAAAQARLAPEKQLCETQTASACQF